MEGRRPAALVTCEEWAAVTSRGTMIQRQTTTVGEER